MSLFRRKLSSSGFTLMELLIVTVLVPVIGLALYANFSAAARLWKRMRFETAAEDRVIAVQKIARSLNAAFKYTPIPFVGEGDRMSFACLTESSPELGGDRAIGQILIYYDARTDAVRKETRSFSEVYRQRTGNVETVLPASGSLELEYYVFDERLRRHEWRGEWQDEKGTLPAAVKFIVASGEYVWEVPVGA